MNKKEFYSTAITSLEKSLPVLLDGSIGMTQAHLWGKHCEPPVNKLVPSDDLIAIDAYGASLLGKNWEEIQYIQLADTVLGFATKPVQNTTP
jgi:uncharacterized protein (DUF362 family)